MRTTPIVFASLVATVALVAIQTSAAPPVVPGRTWRLNELHSDEFPGITLNESKWDKRYNFWDGRPPGFYDGSMVSVNNGLLELDAELAPPGTLPAGMDYTIGTTNTTGGDLNKTSNRHFLYGYFEVSAKGMDARTTSAFWLHRGTADYWIEIDVIELVHQHPRQMPTNLHIFREHGVNVNPDGSSIPNPQRLSFNAAGIPAQENYYNSFHRYGVDWNPDTIDFYLDDVLVRSVVNDRFHHPMWVNLNNAIQYWNGLPTANELDSVDPFQIEYFRAYDYQRRNWLSHPSIEDWGAGGIGDASSWHDETRAWLTRSDEQAYLGDWSLKIDNSQPNDWGRWKQIAPNNNEHDVAPGQFMEQSVWLMITEPLPVDSTRTLDMILRWNGEINGATIDASDLSNVPLNEWTKFDFQTTVPATDVNGQPVTTVDVLYAINNGSDAATLDGTLYFDAAFFGLAQGSNSADFDGDQNVAGSDFLSLQRGFGTKEIATFAQGDANGDGDVDHLDLALWGSQYDSQATINSEVTIVPEPATSLGMLIALTSTLLCRRFPG